MLTHHVTTICGKEGCVSALLVLAIFVLLAI